MTPRRLTCLRFIAWQIELNGKAPTRLEIAMYLDQSPGSVTKHIHWLKAAGYLVPGVGSGSLLSLTDLGRRCCAQDALQSTQGTGSVGEGG